MKAQGFSKIEPNPLYSLPTATTPAPFLGFTGDKLLRSHLGSRETVLKKLRGKGYSDSASRRMKYGADKHLSH